MPDRVPAPLNVTPEGSVDGAQPANAALENVAAGVPVAVAVKLPAVPTVKLVELALVMVGAWSTVRAVSYTHLDVYKRQLSRPWALRLSARSSPQTR